MLTITPFRPEVSRTIAELASAGKLNATGCMTGRPNWPEDARRLRDVPEWVGAGLHLTLTLEQPLTAMALARGGELPGIDALRRLARAGQVDLTEIAAEVRAQLDRFADVLGRAPAFVDAHQHAHALPGIREVVLAETARQAPGASVRKCGEAPVALLLRPYRANAAASAFGSRGLAAAAGRHGLATNHGFAGHYECQAITPRYSRASLPGPGATTSSCVTRARASAPVMRSRRHGPSKPPRLPCCRFRTLRRQSGWRFLAESR